MKVIARLQVAQHAVVVDANAACNIVMVFSDFEVIGLPSLRRLFLEHGIAVKGDGLGGGLFEKVRGLGGMGDDLTRRRDNGAIRIGQAHRAAAEAEHVADFHVIACLGQETVAGGGDKVLTPIRKGKPHEFLGGVGEKLVHDAGDGVAAGVVRQNDVLRCNPLNWLLRPTPKFH